MQKTTKIISTLFVAASILGACSTADIKDVTGDALAGAAVGAGANYLTGNDVATGAAVGAAGGAIVGAIAN